MLGPETQGSKGEAITHAADVVKEGQSCANL